MIGSNLVRPLFDRSFQVDQILWVVNEGHCEELWLRKLDDIAFVV